MRLRGSHLRTQNRSRTSVSGTVTGSFGVPLVPLVPFQLYNIDDGSGEIAVLARSSRTVPIKGAHVKVKGRVGQVASFGRRNVGLHIEEQNRSSQR